MPVFAGGYSNTFVPQIEASDDLRIRYFRPASSFPLSRYSKTRPVAKSIGYYPVIGTDMQARIVDANFGEFLWPDGKPMPSQAGNTESFDLKQFKTVRMVSGFELGAIAAEQAEWNLVADHSAIHMQRMMTLRTMRAVAELTATANYSGNTNDAATILGGAYHWGNSDSAKLYIKKTINYAIKKIMLKTRSAVSVEDLKLVINPTTAETLSNSAEIAEFVKYMAGVGYVKGEMGPNERFGLPKMLYGVELVIEDTVKVTTKKGESTAESFVMGDGYAAIVTRKGSAPAQDRTESASGDSDVVATPSYDTLQIFERKASESDKALIVETKLDVDDKMHKGRIIDDCVPKLVAPASSYLLTAVLGA
jgi:hypothetical protein